MTTTPRFVRAPSDEQLPFGTPVTKTISFGYPLTQTGSLTGEVTVDTLQWGGLTIFQSNTGSGNFVGIKCNWYTRLGTSYESSIIKTEGDVYLPAQNTIQIPFGSESVNFTPLVYSNNIFCGFQVIYIAPNKQKYTQIAVLDDHSTDYTVYTAQSLDIVNTEVLAGFYSVYTNITGICGIDLQIAKLPYAENYTNVTNPTTTLKAKVSKSDDLVVEQIDNSNGEFPLISSITISYSYTKSVTVANTRTKGWSVQGTESASFTVEAGVLCTSEKVSFSMTLSEKYSMSNTHIVSDQQSETKIYTQSCTVTVPPQGKTQLSLSAYTFDDEPSFLAPATVIYYWYRYTDGGIYTSDPIDTNISFSNIDQPVHFSITQTNVT